MPLRRHYITLCVIRRLPPQLHRNKAYHARLFCTYATLDRDIFDARHDFISIAEDACARGGDYLARLLAIFFLLIALGLWSI